MQLDMDQTFLVNLLLFGTLPMIDIPVDRFQMLSGFIFLRQRIVPTQIDDPLCSSGFGLRALLHFVDFSQR